jgi:hypothetical protein
MKPCINCKTETAGSWTVEGKKIHICGNCLQAAAMAAPEHITTQKARLAWLKTQNGQKALGSCKQSAYSFSIKQSAYSFSIKPEMGQL